MMYHLKDRAHLLKTIMSGLSECRIHKLGFDHRITSSRKFAKFPRNYRSSEKLHKYW